LQDEFDALCFQLYSFKPDYFCEELVFEAAGCDSEVDDGGFDANFGDVVGVCEFGGEVELEVCIVGHVLVAQSQQPLLALLHQLLAQNGLEGGVELFFDVLHEHDLAVADSVLEYLEEVGFAEFGDVHVAVLVHVLDPLVGLALRVDDERPPAAVEDENAIVGRERVSGKTVFLPIPDLHLIRQNSCEFVVVGNGDVGLFAFVYPASDHF